MPLELHGSRRVGEQVTEVYNAYLNNTSGRYCHLGGPLAIITIRPVFLDPDPVTTKLDILTLLQREPLTVADLCARLGVTRNSINVQLKQLEAEGAVHRSSRVQSRLPGKPAIVYEAQPGHEDSRSQAYRVFVTNLVAVLGDQLDPQVLSDIFELTGRRLAREAGLPKDTGFDAKLKAAMAAADSLGTNTEAVETEEGIVVRNYNCPVGNAVRSESCVCRTLAAFFSEATGCPASERCQREDKLICQYLIAAPSAGKKSRPGRKGVDD